MKGKMKSIHVKVEENEWKYWKKCRHIFPVEKKKMITEILKKCCNTERNR